MAGTQPDQEPSIEEILASIRQIISDDDETREAGEIEIPKEEEKYDIPLYQPEAEPEEKPRESFADVLNLTDEIKEDSGEEKVINYAEQEEKFDIPLAQPEPVEEEAAPRETDLDLSAKEDNQKRETDLDLSMETTAMKADDIDALFDAPAQNEPEIEMPDVEMKADDVDALFTAPAAAATADALSRLLGNIPVEREENQRLYAEGRITLEDIAKDLMRPMLRQWIDENVPRLVERLVEKELEKLVKQVRED